MMGEAVQRLRHFDYLSNCRYIGFGSIYFVDFVQCHKIPGTSDMLSIEHNAGF